MSSNFDATFNRVSTRRSNELLSNDLGRTKQKGTFSCCIIRAICSLVGIQCDTPEQFNMVKVATKINGLVTEKGFKGKTSKELTKFQKSIEGLRDSFEKGTNAGKDTAVAQLNTAIDVVGKRILKVQGKESVQKKANTRASLAIKEMGQQMERTQQRPASAPIPGQHAEKEDREKAPASAPAGKMRQPGMQEQDGVVEAISRMQGRPGKTTVMTQTVIDPEDQAKMEQGKREGRSGNVVHELRGDDPNDVFRSRKVRQPKKKQEVVVDHTARTERRAVGARLEEQRQLLKKKKT